MLKLLRDLLAAVYKVPLLPRRPRFKAAWLPKIPRKPYPGLPSLLATLTRRKPRTLSITSGTTTHKFYAVAIGETPGIYHTWFGEQGAQKQINGFSRAKFKSFDDRQLAVDFMRHAGGVLEKDIRYFSNSEPSTLPSVRRQRLPSTLLDRLLKTESSTTLAEKSIEAGGYLLRNDDACQFAKYYAVAVGKVPGIYEAWKGERGAQKQTCGFGGALHQGFDTRNMAINFMCNSGVAMEDIMFFKAHFAERANFKPDPSASFNDEHRRLVSSQKWNNSFRIRAAKVDAIRDELITYFLPGGVHIDQVNDDGKIRLHSGQKLEIYQNMCRYTGKRVEATIDQSLVSLKNKPWINIINLINSSRAKTTPIKFTNWNDFLLFTWKDGHRIPLDEAKKNEFLAPLLQDLKREPGQVETTDVPRELDLEHGCQGLSTCTSPASHHTSDALRQVTPVY